jgi:hypothetical protein
VSNIQLKGLFNDLVQELMNRDGLQYGLSVAGLLWYLVMWALSLLGCIVAYALPVPSSTWTQKF